MTEPIATSSSPEPIERLGAGTDAYRRGSRRALAEAGGGLGGIVAFLVIAAAPATVFIGDLPAAARFAIAASALAVGAAGWGASAAIVRWAKRPLRGSWEDQIVEHAAAGRGSAIVADDQWGRGWTGGMLMSSTHVAVGPALVRKHSYVDLVAQLRLSPPGEASSTARAILSPAALGTLPEQPVRVDLWGPGAPDEASEWSRGAPIDAEKWGLPAGWAGRAEATSSWEGVLTPALMRALATLDEPSAVLRIDRDRYALWRTQGSLDVDLEDWVMHGARIAHALSQGRTRELQVTALRLGEDTPADAADPVKTGTIHLRATSIARRRSAFVRSMAAGLAGESVALAALGTLVGATSMGALGTLAAFAVGGAGLAAGAHRHVVALTRRHRAIATQVEHVSGERGLDFRARPAGGAAYWHRTMFGAVRGLTAGPSADGTIASGRGGAVYLEGDYGTPVVAVKAFTSRVVWAALPRPLERVDFVPERFADGLVTLLGGKDVDVESYDFNQRWRVKATDDREAHGILQPSMIDFLNSVDDPSIAFHIDGQRVLIWDDGRVPDVDLGARLRLLEEFISRLPSHLSVPDAPA